MKYFLGTNLLMHDLAFYLVDENANLVFAIEEEKVVKVRYRTTYSHFALDYALKRAKIDRKDIAAVGLSFSLAEYEKLFKLHRELYGKEMASRHEAFTRDVFRYKYNLIDSMGLSGARITELPHHSCHAVSAFSLSPFDSAAVITIDGSGENETLTICHATGSEIIKKASVQRPHSLGWLWYFVTNWLKLGIKGNEGKTMGLAAYGKPVYKDKFYNGFDTKLGKLPMVKVDWNTGLFESPATKELYGRRIRMDEVLGESAPYDSIPSEYQRDIAATLQEVTDEIFLALAKYAKKLTGEENLVLCGGVAMNSVANGVVERSGIFKKVFVPPNAGDNGVGLGGALRVRNLFTGENRYKVKCSLPYTSCEYDGKEIVDALKKFNLPVKKSADIIGETVSELINGAIVGWHQGKLELGARALGNRSILTLPYPGKMKDKVNLKVKFREYWRPFAPVIKEESYREWFEGSAGYQPYMTSTQFFKKDMGKKVLAVVHVDGSGRVQTCSEKTNAKLHKLLTGVERSTSVPILLNTSFNIKGMPIVCSPEDAILCYLCTDIDTLVIGDYIVRKKEHGYGRISLLKVSHASRFLDMTVKAGDRALFITDGSEEEKKKVVDLLDQTLDGKNIKYDVRGPQNAIDADEPVNRLYMVFDSLDVLTDNFLEKNRSKLERLYPLMKKKGLDCYVLNFKGASFVLNELFNKKDLEKVLENNGKA